MVRWMGSTSVSQACTNCYAERLTKRSGQAIWGPNGTRHIVTGNGNRLRKWNDQAAAAGRRRSVFIEDMGDLFEDRPEFVVPRNAYWEQVRHTPWLDHLLLTKRPENVRAMVPSTWLQDWPSNVWLGTTVERQEEARLRIPHLVSVPASVRFLSVEPMLGPVDLSEWSGLIDWVICGAESGGRNKVRETRIEWVRDLRDQCVRSGAAFWMKQWGSVVPPTPVGGVVMQPTPTGMKEFAVLDGQVWTQKPVFRWRREAAPRSIWERLQADDLLPEQTPPERRRLTLVDS